jgi:hypothetical protein
MDFCARVLAILVPVRPCLGDHALGSGICGIVFVRGMIRSQETQCFVFLKSLLKLPVRAGLRPKTDGTKIGGPANPWLYCRGCA